MLAFLSELWEFLRENKKKVWLMPIFLLMTVFGGLVILAQGSPIAPSSIRSSN